MVISQYAQGEATVSVEDNMEEQDQHTGPLSTLPHVTYTERKMDRQEEEEEEEEEVLRNDGYRRVCGKRKMSLALALSLSPVCWIDRLLSFSAC